MFDMVFIFGLALVIFGPKNLGKISGEVGHWLGKARVVSQQLGQSIQAELTEEAQLQSRNQQNVSVAMVHKLNKENSITI